MYKDYDPEKIFTERDYVKISMSNVNSLSEDQKLLIIHLNNCKILILFSRNHKKMDNFHKYIDKS